MTRRSVTNERYRVEQKGNPRKSASSAKPKREAGAAASGKASSSKASAKKAAKRKMWGRGSARTSSPAVVSTPEMKRLRRIWWVFMGVAVMVAVAMFPIAKMKIRYLDSGLMGLYAVALGGALYLEFGPLRKARQAAIAAAKPGAKKAAAMPTAQAATAATAPESLSRRGLSALRGMFIADPSPAKTDNDDAKKAAAGAGGGKDDARG